MKPGIFLLAVSIFSLTFFAGCKKEEGCKALITVKYADDTTKIVPFAHVRITKYDVNVEDQCGSDGTFEHTFKLEAILDVHAWLDTSQTGTPYEKYGETTIRLKEGKTVGKSVFIN